MHTLAIETEPREITTQGKLNDLKKSGWIPAILYGPSKTKESKNALLKVNEKIFLKTLTGHKWSSVILDLKVGSESMNAIIKDIQVDPVSRKLIHLDFRRISMTEKIEAAIPIQMEGESTGVKNQGGTIQHLVHEIKVRCLPADMPEKIIINVSKLEIGQGVSLKEIKPIEGVEMLADMNLLIINVVAPKVEEEVKPTETVATGAAEPEVILKGKKPEEGEAAAAGDKKPDAGKAPEKGKAKAPAGK
jgi:large subunit ribosomal protein L25